MVDTSRGERFTVAEFGIIFNVHGNSAKALRTNASLIEHLDRKVTRLGRTSGRVPLLGGSKALARGRAGGRNRGLAGGGMFLPASLGATTGGLAKGAAEASKFGGSLESVQFQADLAADSMRRLRDAVAGPMIAMGTAGVRLAADVEQAKNKLEFLAKKSGLAAGDIYSEVQMAGLKTLQTTREVTDLTSGLLVQGVNPFVDTLKEMNVELGNGMELSTSAVEVLSDMATIAPFGMRSISMGIRDALGRGKISLTRGLGASMDLSRDKLDRYNKALAQGKGQQEKFNFLIAEMAKDFGGMASAQKDAFNFNMMQIDDYVEKLSTDLFGGVLPLLTKAIQDALGYMQELLDSDKLKPLKRAITEIVTVLVDAARWLGNIAVAVAEFVMANPWIIKMAAALAAVLTVVTSITAALVGVVGMIAALKFAFIAISGMIGPLLIPLAKILLIAGAIGFAFALIARHMTGAKSWMDTWERFKLVAKGVWEIMSSLNGEVGYLSQETGQALQKAGLLDLVVNIANVLHNTKEFLKGYWEGAMKNFKPAVHAALRVWDTVSRVVTKVLDIMDRIFGSGDAVRRTAEGSAKTWKSTGERVADVMTTSFKLMERFLTFIDAVITKIESAIDLIDRHIPDFIKEGQVGKAMEAGGVTSTAQMGFGEKLARFGTLPGLLVTGAQTAFGAAKGGGFGGPAGMSPSDRQAYEQSKVKAFEDANLHTQLSGQLGAEGAAAGMAWRRNLSEAQARGAQKEQQAEQKKFLASLGHTIKEAISRASIKMDGREVNEALGDAAGRGQEAGT